MEVNAPDQKISVIRFFHFQVVSRHVVTPSLASPSKVDTDVENATEKVKKLKFQDQVRSLGTLTLQLLILQGHSKYSNYLVGL